jgi:hypothetical protein
MGLGVRLGGLLRAKGDSLAYQCDMGDFWEHTVVVEEVAAAANGKCRCLAGARRTAQRTAAGPHDTQSCWRR